MSGMKLGTVLPTREVLERGDRFAKQVESEKRDFEEQNGLRDGNGMSLRIVGGERRFYTSPVRYFVVTNRFKVQEFRVTADGDFAVR
jgi:hypothetical protein